VAGSGQVWPGVCGRWLLVWLFGSITSACVVEGALRRHDLVVSSDEDDLQAIAAAVSRGLEVDRP
jgi:hypothetical protein